jgi:transcriptional regulator with AAA-type ATPase domain
MKNKAVLKKEDRNFFSLVVKAIYMNPFLDERQEVLFQISPRWYDDQTIAPELNERISRLERKGLSKIKHFKEEDAQLMMHAYLYQEYVRFFPDFEKLVQSQTRRRDTVVNVPFANKLITRLLSRGFSEKESIRYFALFYQIMRAFYFISLALVGGSPSMKQLRLALWNNVFTYDVGLYDQHLWNRMEDFSTLLLGETGTGKGSAAAAIGRSGFIPFDRKKGRFTHNFMETFVTINLSQYAESLIESELFGHRKGAFTGAVDDHKGLFELCSTHGALFLDEIGDITIPTQIKLLQVLQERTFSPVGSHSLKRFEGRVIAATNRPIEALRKKGNFRDDFFYRLSSDIITVPTLRQRIEESPSELGQMASLLVTRMTGEERPNLTDMILETLKRDLPLGYTWPGNVRELAQAIRRILLTQHYKGDVVVTRPSLEEEFVEKIYAGTLKANELLNNYCNLLYKRFGSYQEVSRRTGLDPRTVKKYLRNNVSGVTS